MLSAQVPLTFTYQAVVRDAQGRLVCNDNVGVRLSILQGSENGTVVYSASQTAHTNANGLFTVLIGTDGNSLAYIDWGAGPYFLKSEVDPTGGSLYTLTTVQQMFSVPYAIRAHLADSVSNETDPVFMSWPKDYNDLINRPTNISTFTNDAGYLTTETDPIFSAWDKDYDDLTNKPTNVSTFTNDAGYLTTEIDPIFSAWDKDYDDLTNKPTTVSTFTNDAGYITISSVPTNISELTNDVGYITVSAVPTNVSELNNDAGYITISSVPTNVSAFTNDAGYLTTYTETDPQFNAWTKDYNDLTNKPTIPTVPTNVSAFNNDAGYLTSYTETDPQFSAWTKDYNDLTNKPTIPTVPTNVSAFTNDAGYLIAYTETQTLANVTALGNYANSQIKNLSDPTDDMDAVNKRTMDSSISVSVTNAVNGLVLRYDSIIAKQQNTIDSLERLLNVTIHVGDTSAIACNSFEWYGTEYTASGDYVRVLTSSNAGDSVVTLHLTINNTQNTTISQKACESYIWESGDGNTYTATGNFVYSHTDINGCQQVDTLHLVIHHNTSGDTSASATDSFIWYGNTYTESGNYTHSLTNLAGCDSVVTLNLTIILGPFTTDGATRSIFTVSSTGRTVRFSKGNLQYNATGSHATADGTSAQGTWRFAEHQYDIIGTGNANISSTYNNWIDLFGWGTSGWNNGNLCYNPWDATVLSGSGAYASNGNGFGPINSINYPEDLRGNYSKSDWGVYNAISNGGNIPNYWRTLTKNEWNYLLNTRTASTVNNIDNARYTKAQVSGRNGIILFPDYYTHPNGVMLPASINDASANYNTNVYTTNDWDSLEAAGCVFLPSAGSRVGLDGNLLTIKKVSGINEHGSYWTSTWPGGNGFTDVAHVFWFNNTEVSLENDIRHNGRSVRLVHDCE